jgi:hypothetical protein
MRPRVATVVIVLCAAALVAACWSDKNTDSTTTSTSNTTTTAAPTTTSTTGGLAGASTTPVSTADQGHTKMTGVQVTNQGGFDRITFEFSGGLPGYTVGYTTRPVQEDASGKNVPVNGDNVLRFRFSGASTVDLSGGKVTNTYKGPKRFSPNTPSIVEMVQTGDFEDVLTWVAGTKGKPGFKVTTDTATGRIVIYVAHS